MAKYEWNIRLWREEIKPGESVFLILSSDKRFPSVNSRFIPIRRGTSLRLSLSPQHRAFHRALVKSLSSLKPPGVIDSLYSSDVKKHQILPYTSFSLVALFPADVSYSHITRMDIHNTGKSLIDVLLSSLHIASWLWPKEEGRWWKIDDKWIVQYDISISLLKDWPEDWPKEEFFYQIELLPLHLSQMLL